LYYKRKFNVHVFNLVEETKQKNHVYLYDEIHGKKSANEIITILDSFLQNIQGPDLVIYADNTVSQNKNHYLLNYFRFLVQTQKFHSIRFKFLLVGHTHFSPDRCFGQIQKKSQNKDIYTIDDFKNICNLCNTETNIVSNLKNWKKYIDNSYGNIKGVTKYAELCFIENQKDLLVSETLQESTRVPIPSNYSKIQMNKTRAQPKLKELETRTLSKEKKKDLATLITSEIIPQKYLDYYTKLSSK
jgi:hypothetical protein